MRLRHRSLPSGHGREGGLFLARPELFTRSRAVRVAACQPRFCALMDPAHHRATYIVSELNVSDFEACPVEVFPACTLSCDPP